MGFQTGELSRDFADFKILRHEDLVGEGDWNPGRKDRMVRVVGLKP